MTDRLNKIIKTFFKTQVAFAEYLQVSKQQVNKYLNNSNVISYDNLIKISNDYNINLHWLLTGQGNMLLSDADTSSTSQQLQALQEENKKLQAQVELLKELLQANSKLS